MDQDRVERAVAKKTATRILPIMCLALLCYFIDKANIGFAALSMNHDLGLSDSVFGFAAGIYALGYAIFCVPSTMMIDRIGPRRGLTLIIAAWGICSAGTAFVTNAQELVVMRFALGAAEAGFGAGSVLIISRWFPATYRGRMMGLFLAIAPLGLVIVGPVSSVLLGLDGLWGLAGWQWLFLIEAVPTFLVALAVFIFFADSPSDVSWMTAEEREWLTSRLDAEHARIGRTTSIEHLAISFLRVPRVWLMAGVALSLGTAGAGLLIFFPLIVKSMGFSDHATGLVTIVPSAFSILAIPLWGLWADRARVREFVPAAGLAAITIGCLGTALLLPSPWALIPLTLALSSYFGTGGAFWSIPSTFLIGAHAAAGTAFINLMANMGFLTGPTLLGVASQISGSHVAGLIALATVAILGTVVMLADMRASLRDKQRAEAHGLSARG